MSWAILLWLRVVFPVLCFSYCYLDCVRCVYILGYVLVYGLLLFGILAGCYMLLGVWFDACLFGVLLD